MDENEGFESMWANLRSTSCEAFDSEDGGDGLMLPLNVFSDGTILLPTSQDLDTQLVDFINNDNDSQDNGVYNLDQISSTELVPDSSQPGVDISGTSIPYCNNIPANTNWPGKYNFDITFDSQTEKTTKSTTWTHSEILDKLFVQTLKAVDIKFKLGSPPPPGCIIRALPIFTKPEHGNDIVRRCPNHCVPSDSTNEGHPAPEHIVRCESKNATYQQCPNSGHLSVIVPYDAPQVGTNYSTYLYKFMCFSSCVGGLNRRPIQLLFTLEKNGEILGRRNLKVRICACPGRDRKTEEKRKLGARSLSRQSSITKSVTSEGTVATPTKRKRDDTIYTVTVRGKENFEILSKVAAGLELLSEAGSERLDGPRPEKQVRLLGEALVRSLSTKGSSSRLRQPKIEKE